MDFSSNHVSCSKKSNIPNVVCAKFDNLVSASECFIGSPTFCNNASCGAVLTSYSVLKDVAGTNNALRTWVCEYCSHENQVKIFEDGIPNASSETVFLLDNSPAKKVEVNEIFQSKLIPNSSYVVFCIDTSVSMTFPVKITNEITKSSIISNKAKISIENPNTKLASGKNQKQITRLDTVQMAICENLAKLEAENPMKQVGLVSFNSRVKVIGDGLNDRKAEFGDDFLEDKSKIEEIVERLPSFQPIQNSKDKLRQELLNLEPSLGTALGPALLCSILIAGRKKGSQVILCTDGMANLGLGKFGKEITPEVKHFYEDLIELAVTKGVTVSIITIEGTECKVSLVGKVADKTNGSIEVADPANLKKEFNTMLEKDTIATNVKATIICPKEMYIKTYIGQASRESKATRDIGNVSKGSDVSFEFDFRQDANIDMDQKTLPIQLQVEYVAPDGSKQLKVITKKVKITKDDKKVEENMNLNIVGSFALKTKVELIENGLPTEELDKLMENVNKFNPTGKVDIFSRKEYNAKKADLDKIQQKNERNSQSMNSASIARHIGPVKGGSEQVELKIDDISASQLYRIKKSRPQDFVENQ